MIHRNLIQEVCDTMSERTIMLGEKFQSLYVLDGFGSESLGRRPVLNFVMITTTASSQDIQLFNLPSSFLTVTFKWFSVAEVIESLEIFPVEFVDMKLRSRLLAGIDILIDLEVNARQLKSRARYLLWTILLKLREGMVRGQSPENLIQASFPMVMISAKFLMDSTDSLRDPASVISAMGAQWELDTTILVKIAGNMDVNPGWISAYYTCVNTIVSRLNGID